MNFFLSPRKLQCLEFLNLFCLIRVSDLEPDELIIQWTQFKTELKTWYGLMLTPHVHHKKHVVVKNVEESQWSCLLFYLGCFLKKIQKLFSRYRNTCKTLAYQVKFPQHFPFSQTLPLVFYNLKVYRKCFLIVNQKTFLRKHVC